MSDTVWYSDPFTAREGAVGAPPLHYGNPIGEQRMLEDGRAVVDLGDRSVIAVTGDDRLSWLDSLLSQRLNRLAPGESSETLLLEPTGRVEYAARVIDDGETTWLLLDAGRGAGLAAFLDRMRFMLRVEVADRSADIATVGTFGEPPTAFAPNGVPLVWRDPWASVVAGGHQYSLVAEHPGSSWTWSETLIERSRLNETDDRPAAGTLALDALRIAAWRPASADADAMTIPHELDWIRTAVHLNKGCYRGQETVAKVHNLGHPPRRLVMLHLDGSEGVPAAAGDEVLLGETVVGRVTTAANHHELGPIALAVIKRSTDPTATLTVRAAVRADAEGAADGGTLMAAAQETIVPTDAGAEADVPRLPRLGAVRR